MTVCYYLCILFYNFWLTQYFPTLWKLSCKVLSDPRSYRHIAITSCLCKTMEQMENGRLT